MPNISRKLALRCADEAKPASSAAAGRVAPARAARIAAAIATQVRYRRNGTPVASLKTTWAPPPRRSLPGASSSAPQHPLRKPLLLPMIRVASQRAGTRAAPAEPRLSCGSPRRRSRGSRPTRFRQPFAPMSVPISGRLQPCGRSVAHEHAPRGAPLRTWVRSGPNRVVVRLVSAESTRNVVTAYQAWAGAVAVVTPPACDRGGPVAME